MSEAQLYFLGLLIAGLFHAIWTYFQTKQNTKDIDELKAGHSDYEKVVDKRLSGIERSLSRIEGKLGVGDV